MLAQCPKCHGIIGIPDPEPPLPPLWAVALQVFVAQLSRIEGVGYPTEIPQDLAMQSFATAEAFLAFARGKREKDGPRLTT